MFIAMKVKSAEDVKGSDSLKVYVFTAPNINDLTIVANLTNVYQVDDVVMIATIGSIVGEIEIKERRLFGINSQGMALGKINAIPGEIFNEYNFE